MVTAYAESIGLCEMGKPWRSQNPALPWWYLDLKKHFSILTECEAILLWKERNLVELAQEYRNNIIVKHSPLAISQLLSNTKFCLTIVHKKV